LANNHHTANPIPAKRLSGDHPSDERSPAETTAAVISSAFPLHSLIPAITPAVYRDLRGLLNRTLESLIGHTPRMQAFLPSKLDSH
jgi:DNA repair protein RecO (recombination protein O)